MDRLIQSYVSLLEEKGIDIDKFVGCSDDDIIILKQCQCVEYLPPLYIDFLKQFGHNINRVVNHELEMDFGIVIYLKQSAIDSLETTSDIVVPNDSFVFAQIVQGIGDYYYFSTSNRNTNPRVYNMRYSTKEVKQVYESLTEFYDIFIDSICERLK